MYDVLFARFHTFVRFHTWANSNAFKRVPPQSWRHQAAMAACPCLSHLVVPLRVAGNVRCKNGVLSENMILYIIRLDFIVT